MAAKTRAIELSPTDRLEAFIATASRDDLAAKVRELSNEVVEHRSHAIRTFAAIRRTMRRLGDHVEQIPREPWTRETRSQDER